MKSFHLAFKVKDIESTRRFYVSILGCEEGRSTESWIDFNFFGHQLSAHVSADRPNLDYCGLVDGVEVPIPHFGCLLDPNQFAIVEDKLTAAGVKFIVKPQVRYAGKSGEQKTLFVLDESDNPIEFKSFTNESEIFSG